MNTRSPLVLAGMLAAAVCLGFFAITHVSYFANIDFLGALLLLQLLLVGLCKFEKIFFPMLMIAFLWAGLRVPLQGVWTQARWAVLGVGAVGGLVIWIQRRHQPFRLFHLAAALCILGATVSAIVSAIPILALSKAGSLFLLFLYGTGGIRLAIMGRESRFFNGLLLACEITAYLSAVCYLVLGLRIFGNQNSLGAAISIGVLPVLLWGWYVGEPGLLRTRRLMALLLAASLVFFSMSRAAIFSVSLVCVALCMALREYKLLVRVGSAVVCLIAFVGVLSPTTFDRSATELTDTVLYKGHKDEGLLGSRQTPWQETVSEIKRHPFFGSGFGTSPTEADASRKFGRFSSTAESNREHGSSYMAIVEWEGLLGIMPFAILLLLVAWQIWKVFAWLRRTRDPRHYSVLLAMVLLAGLAHASFEDWLFAVGSYACVFFWSLAFALGDFLPAPVPVRLRSASFAYPRFGEHLHAPLQGR